MGIVFFCQSCGARFEVAPRMAGRRGHCKKCGQQMTIPRPDEIASMAAVPALAGAGAGAVAVAGVGADGGSIGALLRAGISGVGLSPITIDRMPVAPRRPSPPSALDDAEDSKPYVLAQPVREGRGRVARQDNAALNLWRRQVGGLQGAFRRVHEAAYLISVPFLMLAMFGIMIRNRPMAMTGAAVVVLLNIGRLVAGGVNLALVPLRDGIDPKKLKKPLRRVIEPAFTIGLVVLAFAFIPWLSGGKAAEGGTHHRPGSALDALEKRTQEELDKARALGDAQKTETPR